MERTRFADDLRAANRAMPEMKDMSYGLFAVAIALEMLAIATQGKPVDPARCPEKRAKRAGQRGGRAKHEAQAE